MKGSKLFACKNVAVKPCARAVHSAFYGLVLLSLSLLPVTSAQGTMLYTPLVKSSTCAFHDVDASPYALFSGELLYASLSSLAKSALVSVSSLPVIGRCSCFDDFSSKALTANAHGYSKASNSALRSQVRSLQAQIAFDLNPKETKDSNFVGTLFPREAQVVKARFVDPHSDHFHSSLPLFDASKSYKVAQVAVIIDKQRVAVNQRQVEQQKLLVDQGAGSSIVAYSSRSRYDFERDLALEAIYAQFDQESEQSLQLQNGYSQLRSKSSRGYTSSSSRVIKPRNVQESSASSRIVSHAGSKPYTREEVERELLARANAVNTASSNAQEQATSSHTFAPNEQKTTPATQPKVKIRLNSDDERSVFNTLTEYAPEVLVSDKHGLVKLSRDNVEWKANFLQHLSHMTMEDLMRSMEYERDLRRKHALPQRHKLATFAEQEGGNVADTVTRYFKANQKPKGFLIVGSEDKAQVQSSAQRKMKPTHYLSRQEQRAKELRERGEKIGNRYKFTLE